MPSHYEVLGVEPTAAPEDLRRAYHDRARELHPDRQAGTGTLQAAKAARAMQEVNEAWRVLRAPDSRARYDGQLLAPTQPLAPTPGDVDPDDTPYPSGPPADPGDLTVRLVRGLPWVAALVVLAAIFIFTAFAAGSTDDRPSGSEWIGRCVGTVTGVGTTAVSCDEPGARRVDLVVVRQSLCPSGVSAVPVGDLWLCVRPVDRSP